jgi:glycosyltransferase involved in cell wall biosynthesis
MKKNYSVLIITYNEMLNLPNCLEAIKGCDDIVVLDSFSTDKTEEIAKKYGARFYQRKFDNFANQRNYGLREINYKNHWLFMIDADEVIPKELSNEIDVTINSNDNKISLYYMRRKDFFLGKWIKHSSGYPSWFGRLMRVSDVEVRRKINEEYYTKGKKGFLRKHLLHYPFNNGFQRWIEKHNKYSQMEAELLALSVNEKLNWKDVIGKDPIKKRKAIKSIFYRIPGRPFFMFCVLYFLRGGFLDGKAGLIFCSLKAFYEFMIDCKVLEIKFLKNERTI